MKILVSAISALLLTTTAAMADDKLVFSYDGHAQERALVIAGESSYQEYIAKKIMKPEDIGIALYDLNGDGNPEIISYAQNSITCGAHGCDLRVYENNGGKLQELLGGVIAADVVKVSPNTKNDMKSLVLGGPRGASVWSFDGRKYKLASR